MSGICGLLISTYTVCTLKTTFVERRIQPAIEDYEKKKKLAVIDKSTTKKEQDTTKEPGKQQLTKRRIKKDLKIKLFKLCI